jgi:WD40 repeat protein
MILFDSGKRSRFQSSLGPRGQWPDGRRTASGGGSDDQTVKLWDAQTGQETITLRGNTGSVESVAFSPDGKRLASGSVNGTVKIWDGTPLAETPARGALPAGQQRREGNVGS